MMHKSRTHLEVFLTEIGAVRQGDTMSTQL